MENRNIMAGDERISSGCNGLKVLGGRLVFLRAAGPEAGSGTECRSREGERLDRAQRFGGVGLWEGDLRSGALWWSGGVPPLFGAAAIEAETNYARFLELVWPQDRPAVAAAVDICLKGGSIRNRASRPVARWQRSLAARARRG